MADFMAGLRGFAGGALLKEFLAALDAACEVKRRSLVHAPVYSGGD